LWRRTYGSRDKDYEAQCFAVTPDDYLVGGCSEGYASPDGGKDWKAFLFKVSSDGRRVWKRPYRLRGNECVYFILAEDDGVMLMGETEKSLFFMKTDEQAKEMDEVLWLGRKRSDSSGVIPEGRGYLFGRSFAGDESCHIF